MAISTLHQTVDSLSTCKQVNYSSKDLFVFIVFVILSFLGFIESNNIDWQPWALNVPTNFVFPGISLSHSMQLLNSCGPIDFTHFAGHFTGMLDYIFCDSQHFSSQRVAPMPALWEVSRETALPNTWFPSDHLPIVCDLEIK